MKIFHITDALPDYHQIWGGAEKVAYRQIIMSAKLKEAEVFVGAVKPIKKLTESFRFFRVWTVEDILPQKLGHYFSKFKNQIIPFDIISFFSLACIILKIKPNVIHIHKTVSISLTPIIVAKMFKIPVILAVYDYWGFCPNRLLIDKQINPCYRFHGPWCKKCSSLENRFLMKVISNFRKRIFNFFLLRVDRFSVLSSACRDLISKYPLPKQKIFLVRQLSIVFEEDRSMPIEPNSIFFNTWMLPHKGVHIVVRAIAEVIKKNPQARLYLAVKDAGHYSNPAFYEEIKKLISDLNLVKNIIILGGLNHQEYLRYIHKASLVVVAEQWENMAPTTLADAMSLAKPVVASNIGGLPEMVGETGFLADPRDPKDFAEKIIKILSDSVLAKKLGQSAAERIKLFGSEEIIQGQLLNLYQI